VQKNENELIFNNYEEFEDFIKKQKLYTAEIKDNIKNI
jgi:hypothetical protein